MATNSSNPIGRLMLNIVCYVLEAIMFQFIWNHFTLPEQHLAFVPVLVTCAVLFVADMALKGLIFMLGDR